MEQQDIEKIARRCVEICEEHKAADIRLFDVQENSILADYFIVCSATSLPHLRALAERLRRTLIDEGVKPRGLDGNPSSQWLVLDYGVIIVHIMMPELRRRYALEEIWDKGKMIYSGGVPLPAARPVSLGATSASAAPLPADIDEGYPIDERFLDPGAAEDDDN